MKVLKPYYTQGFAYFETLLEEAQRYFPQGFFEVKKSEKLPFVISEGIFGILRGCFDSKIFDSAKGIPHNPGEIILTAMHQPLISEVMGGEAFEKYLATASLMRFEDNCFFALVSSYGMKEHFGRTIKTAAQQLGLASVGEYCSDNNCLLYAAPMIVKPQDETRLQLSTRWMDKMHGFCEKHSKALESMLA